MKLRRLISVFIVAANVGCVTPLIAPDEFIEVAEPALMRAGDGRWRRVSFTKSRLSGQIHSWIYLSPYGLDVASVCGDAWRALDTIGGEKYQGTIGLVVEYKVAHECEPPRESDEETVDNALLELARAQTPEPNKNCGWWLHVRGGSFFGFGENSPDIRPFDGVPMEEVGAAGISGDGEHLATFEGEDVRLTAIRRVSVYKVNHLEAASSLVWTAPIAERFCFRVSVSRGGHSVALVCTDYWNETEDRRIIRHYKLVVVNQETKSPAVVATGVAGMSSLAWNSDGTRIVFSSEKNEVVIAGVNGERKALSNIKSNYLRPQWTSKNELLIVSGSSLVFISPETELMRRVSAWDDSGYFHLVISPDARFAIAHRNRGVELFDSYLIDLSSGDSLKLGKSAIDAGTTGWAGTLCN